MSRKLYMSDTRNLKKRRLDNGIAIGTFISRDFGRDRKLPIPMREPVLQTNVQILHSQSPQDLIYAIQTSDKTLFTKQELLDIITKLHHMYNPQFPEPCTYIS